MADWVDLVSVDPDWAQVLTVACRDAGVDLDPANLDVLAILYGRSADGDSLAIVQHSDSGIPGIGGRYLLIRANRTKGRIDAADSWEALRGHLSAQEAFRLLGNEVNDPFDAALRD